MHTSDLAYPIGRFHVPEQVADDQRREHIAAIADLPPAVRRTVERLDDRQLDTPYRSGGWTVRQVVHHLPDSHMNAYMRFKLALTEDEPTIRTYEEARWAELPDAKSGPITPSLDLLAVLHLRWVACLRAVPPAAFARRFRHPDLGVMSIDQLLALYAWHGRHHLAHITGVASREGWTL
jgi:hypothetical protein